MPPSRPRPAAEAEPETIGHVYLMVQWIDANKGAFFLSRLIMQSGVNLRAFERKTPDDPRVLAKIWPVLNTLLSTEEREALQRVLRDGIA